MMRTLSACLIALFFLHEPAAAQEVTAAQREQIAKILQGQMSPAEAKALEEKVRSKPDDLDARSQLIRYYFVARLASRTAEFEERRQEHIFWLIEHYPGDELAGTPEAGIDSVGFSSGGTETYQRGKKLWLQQVQLNPNNRKILGNAAQYFSMADRKISRNLLEKVLQLAPSDMQAATMLAQTYKFEGMMESSSERKTEFARKAFGILENTLAYAEGDLRFYQLDGISEAALDAGETSKAKQYALELLESAKSRKTDWNYGNAIHNGNLILGMIALDQGDVSGAKQYLIAGGNTPGSPQLDSFGPSMKLAKRLIEKGERDTVLEYFAACAKFWKMGADELRQWTATVKAGGMPDFGQNLRD